MDFVTILSDSLQQALGPTAVIYCLAAIGLNVHFGYTGLLNFGQAGFMMVAGYSLATAVTIFSTSLWAGVLVGLLLAVVLALLLGVPTLRLRADYLAIVTIAAAEIIRQTVGAADEIRRQSRPKSPADSRQVAQRVERETLGGLPPHRDRVGVLEAERREPAHAEALAELARHLRVRGPRVGRRRGPGARPVVVDQLTAVGQRRRGPGHGTIGVEHACTLLT